MSGQLLADFEADSPNFFGQIVAEDDTWIHYYDPTTEKQSKERRKVGEPSLLTLKACASVGKEKMTVFWDSRGPILIDFLSGGKNFNNEYYCVILEQLREKIKEKRRGRVLNGILLQQDNSSSHTAMTTTTKSNQLGCKILPHPPYSPDLALSNFSSLEI